MSVRQATKQEHLTLPQFPTRELAKAEAIRRYQADGETYWPHRCKRDGKGNIGGTRHFHVVKRKAATACDGHMSSSSSELFTVEQSCTPTTIEPGT